MVLPCPERLIGEAFFALVIYMKEPLKQYKTIEEQIEILKERGCIISDVSSARETLSKVNYYRLTAYFLPFIDKDSIEKKYVKSTTFEKIVALHEFDRKLRSLLLQALDHIEITLRERLARAHIENHNRNPIAYLNIENFSFTDTIEEKDKKYKKVKKTKKENEQYFLKTICDKISQNKRNFLIKQLDEKVIKKLEQGVNDCKELKLPFWVIVEFLSFGELSRLYTNLQEDDRNRIAEQFIPEYISGKTRREYLENWFHCCSNLRNRCAHLGVLYNNNSFTPTPKGFKNTNISKSLWAFILVIKWLHPYSDEWHEEFIPQIKILMDKYSKDIDLKHFSFPDKWEEELGKSQKSSLEENVKRYILNKNKRYKKKKLVQKTHMDIA